MKRNPREIYVGSKFNIQPDELYKVNKGKNSIHGPKGIDRFDWSTFVLADLQYVIEMADKSILKKLKNN